MNLLILAFKGTTAEKVAIKLRTPSEKIYLQSGKDWLEQFVLDIELAKYDYIVVMGQYSGRDKESIRIETECTSQFRNQKENLNRLTITYFFEPKSPFKLASGIGNSWCNLISYRLLSKMPDAKLTFLHVPKNFDITAAVLAVDQQLDRCNRAYKPHELATSNRLRYNSIKST